MLEGLKQINCQIHRDHRGIFLETYQRQRYKDQGVEVEFCQDNHSVSKRGVVRGMHFQPGQAKLVMCLKGEILDVAVDIRPHSKTFGKYEMVHLSDANHHQLYIPEGFAHGFCVLSAEAFVIYKVSTFYDPLREGGFRYDDPQVKIPWPVSQPLVSEKDQQACLLQELDLW